MNLIVAADKHWAIGNKGKLLVTIPQDQQTFRSMTLGKVVVMGRKTLESLPGGQPLYGRTNIVLTSDPSYRAKGAVVCHSMDEALHELKQYADEDVYIIGGQTIYEQFLGLCSEAHVTAIDFSYDADTYFPNLDRDPEWELVEESDEQTYFDLCYTYRRYRKKQDANIKS